MPPSPESPNAAGLRGFTNDREITMTTIMDTAKTMGQCRQDIEWILEAVCMDRTAPIGDPIKVRDNGKATPNGERNGRLTKGVVRSVRAAARRADQTQRQIAEEYGIHPSVVSAIHTGRAYAPS